MRDVVTRIVLDVETGIDDALALLDAGSHPKLDLGAITCVSGNVALRQVVRNTCSVLDLADAREVPVGSGADATLLGQGARPGHWHGANGLGDLPVHAPGSEPHPDTAVELLRDQLLHAERPEDAGALVMLTNPELFQVQRAPVRIGLHGAERGRTLIDPAAPIIDVVTAVNAAQAAQRFVDVVP